MTDVTSTSSPGYEGRFGSETGRAVRYDTRGDFKDPASYVIYDAGNTDGLESRNYDGATFDGRYVYYCAAQRPRHRAKTR